MTPCPACQKPVDPLRSRFVGVLDGKIVAYCSAACAATNPAAAAATVAKPAPVATPPAAVPSPAPSVRLTPAGIPMAVPSTIDSGPVIEIIREPSGRAASGDDDNDDDEPIELRKQPKADPAAPRAVLADDKSGLTAISAGASKSGEPRAKHPDEIAISNYWSTDKARGATGPVPRIEQTESISDELDELQVRRRWPLVLLVIALLGGAAALIYQYVMKGKVAAATAPRPIAPAIIEPRPAEPVVPAPPPPISPAEAVAQATQTLRTNLAATSQRVQRLAAAALARTGDPSARDALAAQLGLIAATPAAHVPAETSDIARLDMAYSLARGGDTRGRDVLAAALGSPRAEARDEAARLLALLGDARAIPHLTDLLSISQRRLGAAEHLAHLDEPHAIKILSQIRGDARASADDKSRAVIALGIAGHADVAPALRDMLGDPHVNAFAAAALAALGDAAARPVLEHQLDSPMLRVRAARALRKLDPALDPAPMLPRLLGLLRTGRDTDQIQAAEAILVLAGPPALADYE